MVGLHAQLESWIYAPKYTAKQEHYHFEKYGSPPEDDTHDNINLERASYVQLTWDVSLPVTQLSVGIRKVINYL